MHVGADILHNTRKSIRCLFSTDSPGRCTGHRECTGKKMPVSQRNSLVAPLCWQRLMLRRGYDRTLLEEIEMLKPSKRAVRQVVVLNTRNQVHASITKILLHVVVCQSQPTDSDTTGQKCLRNSSGPTLLLVATPQSFS